MSFAKKPSVQLAFSTRNCLKALMGLQANDSMSPARPLKQHRLKRHEAFILGEELRRSILAKETPCCTFFVNAG